MITNYCHNYYDLINAVKRVLQIVKYDAVSGGGRLLVVACVCWEVAPHPRRLLATVKRRITKNRFNDGRIHYYYKKIENNI